MEIKRVVEMVRRSRKMKQEVSLQPAQCFTNDSSSSNNKEVKHKGKAKSPGQWSKKRKGHRQRRLRWVGITGGRKLFSSPFLPREISLTFEASLHFTLCMFLTRRVVTVSAAFGVKCLKHDVAQDLLGDENLKPVDCQLCRTT